MLYFTKYVRVKIPNVSGRIQDGAKLFAGEKKRKITLDENNLICVLRRVNCLVIKGKGEVK